MIIQRSLEKCVSPGADGERCAGLMYIPLYKSFHLTVGTKKYATGYKLMKLYRRLFLEWVCTRPGRCLCLKTLTK